MLSKNATTLLAVALCASPLSCHPRSEEALDEVGDVPSFEALRAQTRVVNYGYERYLVDGDIPLTEAQLREFHEDWLEASAGPIGTQRQGLTVQQTGGVDAIHPPSVIRNFRYCVSDDWGADKPRAVAEMAQAADDWETAVAAEGGAIDLVYVPAEDANCEVVSTAIDIAVLPWTGPGACAFIGTSSLQCVGKGLLMNLAAFDSSPLNASIEVFRHEIGHTLGLRHEHIRFAGGCTESDTDFRGVTAYDSVSIMHYPECPGSTITNNNTGLFTISTLDAEGVAELYPRRGVAFVTHTGGTTTYEPPTTASWNDGNSMEIRNVVPGQSVVTFDRLAGATRGNAIVSAQGPNTNRCKVGRIVVDPVADETRIDVLCFNAAGAPTDSPFTLAYANEANGLELGAYLMSDEPTPLDQYTPNLGQPGTGAAAVPYRQFSDSGLNGTVSRRSTGRYDVFLPDILPSGTDEGVAMASAHGMNDVFCKVSGQSNWSTNATIEVYCFDPSGAPADARFLLRYFKGGEPTLDAYLRHDTPMSAVLERPPVAFPLPISPTEGHSVDRVTTSGGALAPGQYLVDLTDHEIEHHQAAGLVQGQGLNPVLCHAIGMMSTGPLSTYGVTCFNPIAGAAVDARFTLVQVDRLD